MNFKLYRSLIFVSVFAMCVATSRADTFVVQYTLDLGIDNTLRDAIESANANPGPDRIEFNVLNCIVSNGPLPDITDELIIDGGDFRVFIDGTGTAATGTGLTIDAAGCSIENLEIREFATGIELTADESSAELTVDSCIIGNCTGDAISNTGNDSVIKLTNSYIGYSDEGVTASPIGGNGVILAGGGTGNEIGPGNVIGNCGQDGIRINSNNTRVIDCHIGIGADGETAHPNTNDGIHITADNDSTTTRLMVVENCVISGNGQDGIQLEGAEALVSGNIIGLNANGDGIVSNGRYGIIAGGSSSDSLIQNNTISGNNTGVFVGNSVSIEGNVIGLNPDGNAAFGNNFNGITVIADDAMIGGNSGDQRNVIGGNGDNGIRLVGANANVQGNFIGLNLDGSAAMGNMGNGIVVESSSSNSMIQDNVISGNNSHGIRLQQGATVVGNWIGLEADGMSPIGNGEDGVLMEFSGGVVGGPAEGDGNTISGNTGAGVRLAAQNCSIFGNIIGLAADGDSIVGNSVGVVVEDEDATIGGATPGEGNVISGNDMHGVVVADRDAEIVGNIIGLDTSGSADRGNGASGIHVQGSLSGPRIGGFDKSEGNVISGNGEDGIYVESPSVPILNNIIGLDRLGEFAIGNGRHGIFFDGAFAVIGSLSADSGNVISGNAADGIRLVHHEYGEICGNIIGLASDGITPLGNGGRGLHVDGEDPLQIGGASTGTGNVISANGSDGILIGGSVSPIFTRNIVGLTSGGLTVAGNGGNGITLSSSYFNGIGAWSSGENRNIISGNEGYGVFVDSTGGGQITGATVGLLLDGETPARNFNGGIYVEAADFLTIGGSSETDRNTISGNSGNGVQLEAPGVRVEGNNIGLTRDGTGAAGNGRHGIQLGFDSEGGVSVIHNNLIGNNGMDGINAHYNPIISENVVGTDASQTMDFGNGRTGVSLAHSVVSGDFLIDSNVIVNSAGDGIVANQGAFDIRSNYIGVSSDLSTPLGNGASGIKINPDTVGTSETLKIGGTNATANYIMHNGQHGIATFAEGADLNLAVNIISKNMLQSVALGPGTGLLSNDLNDVDTGPNDLINSPFVVPAHPGQSHVEVYLQSVPNTLFRIYVYHSDSVARGGTGEMVTLVDDTVVTTDNSGVARALLFGSAGSGYFSAAAQMTSTGASSQVGRATPIQFGVVPVVADIIRPPGVPEQTSAPVLPFDVQFNEPVTFRGPGPVTISADGTISGFTIGDIESDFLQAAVPGGSAVMESTKELNMGNSSWTWELWLKSNSRGEGTLFSLINSSDEVVSSFSRNDSGYLEFSVGTGGEASVSTLQAYNVTGEWHHWAGIYDSTSSELRLYRNGELLAAEEEVPMLDIRGTLSLAGGPEYFDGTIEEFRIWSDVRSNSEIESGLFMPLSGTGSNLAAYYSFDRFVNLGVGVAGANDVKDKSGNGVHLDVGDVMLASSTVYSPVWTIDLIAGVGSGSIDVELERTAHFDSDLLNQSFFGIITRFDDGEHYIFSEPVPGPEWFVIH